MHSDIQISTVHLVESEGNRERKNNTASLTFFKASCDYYMYVYNDSCGKYLNFR